MSASKYRGAGTLAYGDMKLLFVMTHQVEVVFVLTMLTKTPTP